MLPLLALTWMSAVLAMTDKRSILFQILFAVFDSLQGFVIVMVHCILRREVRNDFPVFQRAVLLLIFQLHFNVIYSLFCRNVFHGTRKIIYGYMYRNK